MWEFFIALLEILLILGIIIFIFIFSAISADTITSLISFLIFLILLIPFYILLENLEILAYVHNFENILFFKLIFSYTTLINLFIGIFFVIQLIYLTIFS
jgi:hypothetical protein